MMIQEEREAKNKGTCSSGRFMIVQRETREEKGKARRENKGDGLTAGAACATCLKVKKTEKEEGVDFRK
jgi:hypothetical protein